MAKTLAGKQPDPKTETDLINQVLADKDISMNHLADTTGIPYATLRRSLKGNRALNLIEIRAIAAALEVWPSDILPEELTATSEAA
jgi:DNA-binding Xre family transcriptional regulator